MSVNTNSELIAMLSAHTAGFTAAQVVEELEEETTGRHAEGAGEIVAHLASTARTLEAIVITTAKVAAHLWSRRRHCGGS